MGKPKALKVYRSTTGYAPTAALALAGAENYSQQGTVLIAATSAVGAAVVGYEAGMDGRPGSWREYTGDLTEYTEAGLLQHEGETLVMRSNRRPLSIVAYDRVEKRWSVVAGYEGDRIVPVDRPVRLLIELDEGTTPEVLAALRGGRIHLDAFGACAGGRVVEEGGQP